MKNQRSTQVFVGNMTGFEAPRGWALKWEGEGLSEGKAHVPRNGDGQEAMAETERPWPRNGSGPARFARPQGWALCWDGYALSESQEEQYEGAA